MISEEYSMKRKWLVLGIILLFVGVTIAPTINFNTVKASNDNDLVEVTAQACGIKGYKDSTVKLTREQYNELEQYLVEFKAKLNQTSTREEATPLFRDAMVELNKYGLLPKGNIKLIEDLFTENFLNSRILNSFYKIRHESSYGKGQRIINQKCLVVANGRLGIELNLFFFLCIILLSIAIFIPEVITVYYSQIKPFHLICIAGLYYCQLFTSGLLGKVNYDNINDVTLKYFTGVKIITKLNPPNGIYIGFASEVKAE